MNDDDDLTPWNPAHFGHTDFQKESDGQLTIFFEDAHEPPDPDDFASLEAYEIAWVEWEQTQQTSPQQEDKQITGKLFDSMAARPLAEDDIKILSRGDWVKAEGESFCYQFRHWDENYSVAVVTYNHKEFLIPAHQLMVCTRIDGDVVEKFKNIKVSIPLTPVSQPIAAINNIHSRKDEEFEKLIEGIEKSFDSTTQQQEGKIMTFNITTPFDSEIEQLKVKLAELETQKHRISTRANKIVEQVGECVFEMKEAGVSDGVLSNWACLIYREVTGEDVPALSNADVLKGATAWEEKYKQLFAITSKQIAQLTTERDELSNKPQGANEPLGIDLLKKVSDLTIERDTALQKITDLTAASLRISDELFVAREKISQLKSDLKTVVAQRDHQEELQSGNGETSDNLVIEGYKKTILELTNANQKITEEVLKLRGENPCLILKEPRPLAEETDAQPEESEEVAQPNFAIGDFVRPVHKDYDNHPNGRVIKLLGDDAVIVEFYETKETRADQIPFGLDEIRLHLDNEVFKTQEIVSKFLKKLDRIARVDKLDWVKIKELPLNLETMRELGLQVIPKSKTHKYLLEQMPVMCARYIEETGDSSDLDWLPGHFVESVRKALSEISDATEEKTPRATSLSEIKPTFQRGDTVRHLYLDSVCTVLDVNGGWLNVQDDDGLTDMWGVSDVELVAELAA